MMNDPKRGIVCIRYIDDFIILGKKADHVRKAMASARSHLTGSDHSCRLKLVRRACVESMRLGRHAGRMTNERLRVPIHA
jgi:hypothetical protein